MKKYIFFKAYIGLRRNFLSPTTYIDPLPKIINPLPKITLLFRPPKLLSLPIGQPIGGKTNFCHLYGRLYYCQQHAFCDDFNSSPKPNFL